MHHVRFRKVAAALETAHKEGVPGIEHLPLLFRPSPVTGQYGEFDDALIRTQEGIAGSPNPYYPGLNLTLSKQQAYDILLDFTPDERKMLTRLADVYQATAPPQTADSALASA
jgi:hypothetical protein